MALGEKDTSGRRRPVPLPGSEFMLQADLVLLAVGERPDTSYITAQSGLILVKENIAADKDTLATARSGVFAGGDGVTGPNTVVEAMGAGKAAAEAIAKYLEGRPLDPEYTLCRPSVFVPPVAVPPDEAAEAKRPAPRYLAPAERRKNFREVALPLTELEAGREARRCLRCELETKEGKAAVGRT
jgi:pyruvate/2-oxoglutarate dehydrogenase complex dihydrolipoamide dehydrogenase (E3) component